MLSTAGVGNVIQGEGFRITKWSPPEVRCSSLLFSQSCCAPAYRPVAPSLQSGCCALCFP